MYLELLIIYTSFLVDTKNSTYLTSHGMSILREKPYIDLKIVVNVDRIVQPNKERYRKLSDVESGDYPVDKENCEYISFL